MLRLGVIGLGRAAATMIPSLLAHPHVVLTAGADPNPAARERFTTTYGGAAYENAEELCAGGDVDAVYIATPHQFHESDALAALNRGKHAIVEKPMALTLAECRAMTGAAERNGLVLIVGHSHAFDPSTAIMRDLIRGGTIGPLRMIANLVYTDFLYRPRRPEELDTSRGGGIFYNQIPHQIDLVRALDGGPLHSVRAIAGIWDRARRTEGAMTALLEFADGVGVSLTYSGYDHFDTDEFHAWVGEGGAEKPGDGHGATRRKLRNFATPDDEIRARAASGFAGSGTARGSGAQHHPHFGLLLVSCDGADMRPTPDGVRLYTDDGTRDIIAPPARAYPNKDAVIDEFYDAIVNGVPAVHDGAWGTATMEASLALLQSARERREIMLDAPVFS
jgi:phthalate 4,5-cis-dihydrodiol dehydrogenase